ncbi:DUF5071 domain-containing protein [Mesorhizobium silamurunense]|uniref:DUF5071 domain-containing protein n=1 Tax=Mesorhizobium silamurunense TaxID=499528 RepID=UPI0017808F72
MAAGHELACRSRTPAGDRRHRWPLAPYLREILRGNDDIWIYWILNCVVAYSPSLADSLRDELEQLAAAGSSKEGVRELARDILGGNFHKLD